MKFPNFECFHTYHIYRWLTGDQILLERYLDICHDTRLSKEHRAVLLKNFAVDIRNSLIDSVKWEELVERGSQIPNPKKEKA